MTTACYSIFSYKKSLAFFKTIFSRLKGVPSLLDNPVRKSKYLRVVINTNHYSDGMESIFLIKPQSLLKEPSISLTSILYMYTNAKHQLLVRLCWQLSVYHCTQACVSIVRTSMNHVVQTSMNHILRNSRYHST